METIPVGVAAGAKIFAGGMVDVNASGYAQPAATNTTCAAAGRAEADCDNTSGGNGALIVTVRRGTFLWDNSASADQITVANLLQDCYVVDDHTVALTSGSSTRHRAGKVMGIDSVTGGVFVQTVFY